MEDRETTNRKDIRAEDDYVVQIRSTESIPVELIEMGNGRRGERGKTRNFLK